VPTISAWLWLYPIARSRPIAVQVSRRVVSTPRNAISPNITIASRDSYSYCRAKLVDMTSSAISPTPFATATSSSRNRRSRWIWYCPAIRYETSDRMTTSGRLPKQRAKSGWWLLTRGMPVSKRRKYAATQAAEVTATSQTRNQVMSV
jgi:hypothetical protein